MKKQLSCVSAPGEFLSPKLKSIHPHLGWVKSKMGRRRAARHFVESPDRWAEWRRGPRDQTEAICAFEAVTRAMLPFPRGESWGVNKLAPGGGGTPSWWSSARKHLQFTQLTLPKLGQAPINLVRGRGATRRGAHTPRRDAGTAYHKFAAVRGVSLTCMLRVFRRFRQPSAPSTAPPRTKAIADPGDFLPYVNVPISYRKLLSAKFYYSLNYTENYDSKRKK